jgi:TRAP-type uncharacterized transport system fused permease subunit
MTRTRAYHWFLLASLIGGLMTVLVLEYSRKHHMPLFMLNILLILYAVYGYVVPGMFYHSGLSWQRVARGAFWKNCAGASAKASARSSSSNTSSGCCEIIS